MQNLVKRNNTVHKYLFTRRRHNKQDLKHCIKK